MDLAWGKRLQWEVSGGGQERKLLPFTSGLGTVLSHTYFAGVLRGAWKRHLPWGGGGRDRWGPKQPTAVASLPSFSKSHGLKRVSPPSPVSLRGKGWWRQNLRSCFQRWRITMVVWWLKPLHYDSPTDWNLYFPISIIPRENDFMCQKIFQEHER